MNPKSCVVRQSDYSKAQVCVRTEELSAAQNQRAASIRHVEASLREFSSVDKRSFNQRLVLTR